MLAIFTTDSSMLTMPTFVSNYVNNAHRCFSLILCLQCPPMFIIMLTMPTNVSSMLTMPTVFSSMLKRPTAVSSRLTMPTDVSYYVNNAHLCFLLIICSQ